MSILSDLVLDLLGAGFGPSSDRGLVALFTAGSLVSAVATVWLLATSPDPVRQPAWGLGVFAAAILCGAAGLLISVLHLRRSSDRGLSLLYLTSNLAAVAIPVYWLFVR